MVTFAEARTQKLAAIESAIAQSATADPSRDLSYLWHQWAQLQTSDGSGGAGAGNAGGAGSGGAGAGTTGLSPLGNGTAIAAPSEGSTAAAIAYEPGASFARIQVTQGQIRFANGETPNSAPLIFTAGNNDVIALESQSQVENFRFTASGAGAAAIAVQQYG